MSASPNHEFHMPGAYHFDNPPAFTTRALGADVFLPPVASSPSDSVLNLARSTGSLYSEISTTAGGYEHGATAKRKRAAQDSRESTPLAEWADTNLESARGRRFLERGGGGSLEHNGIAYTLAGQIDVAGVPASGVMDESVYSDVEYRRALGPHPAPFHAASLGDVSPDGVPQTDAERWNVLHALGNVVGKVWEFCTTGAFRGFHAGGGAGYDWETGKATGPPMGDVQTNGQQQHQQQQQQRQQGAETEWQRNTDDGSLSTASEMPSMTSFSFDGGGGDASARTADRNRGGGGDTTPQRTGKRRQVSLAGDELGRNWVIVDSRQKNGSVQPSRGTAAGSNTRTPDRRTSYLRGTTGTNSATVTPGTAAAASRRINTPISRLGGTTPSSHNRRARVSHAGSPALSSREPASFASPRSSTPVGASTRRPFASSIGGTHSPGGGSRIPVPLSGADASNPFARAASSPRPGSRAGLARLGSTAAGAGYNHSLASGSHRRSHSGRVDTSPAPKTVPKKAAFDSGTEGTVVESPRLNDEAKRLAAQNLAAEQDADAKMEAFNLRLKEMIRQGQEALGTTFEVDGDDAGPEDYWADDI